MKLYLLFLISTLFIGSKSIAQVTYQPEDSVKVEMLLNKGGRQPADVNLVMFYAKELLDVPYVAQTLEVNSEEQLVVNLRGLDCTTYVETVLALVLTSRHGGRSFADYCQWLRLLRYDRGQMDGYASRNHYFSQWISSNVSQGFVTEIVGSELDRRGAYYPFVEAQVINLNWMTTHVQSYPMMAGKPHVVERIRRAEQSSSGATVRYIPQRLLGHGHSDLEVIRDGDILAIVTNKQGLDTSHLGFAAWGSDGRLHLLNASQIHKKVVLEPMTLATYMSKHPSQLGIRVVRLLDN